LIGIKFTYLLELIPDKCKQDPDPVFKFGFSGSGTGRKRTYRNPQPWTRWRKICREIRTRKLAQTCVTNPDLGIESARGGWIQLRIRTPNALVSTGVEACLMYCAK